MITQPRFSKLANWLVGLISLITVFLTYVVSDRIYERMAHFEDEMAYVWQAQAAASGDLILPSPPNPKSFMTPFVIDHNGSRFGKYPPGWPVMLSFGFMLGLEDWVNPVLTGFGIWLLYLLARRLTSQWIGLLAVILMLSSPMFWLLSGSLLSHSWSLLLSLGFVLAWLDLSERNGFVDKTIGDTREREKEKNAPGLTSNVPDWLLILVAGLCLGILVLTRPMNAIGVALPFFAHGIYLLLRGRKTLRLHVIQIGLIGLFVGGLLFAWQFAVTGDPFLNPYTLWWEYDKYGFGDGFGRWGDGHTLDHAKFIIEYSLWSPRGTRADVLGWEQLWWVFIPFGMWALRKRVSAWLVFFIFPSLILAYVPYWIGSWQYGPRYYYEGMLAIAIFTAAGLFWLAGNRLVIRKILAIVALAIFIGYNLFTYLPGRLQEMHGMYNINRSMLIPFYTIAAEEIKPAIIIVHQRKEWTEYGGLIELQNAQLTTPFIFAINRSDSIVSDFYDGFPDRQLYHYYPDEPFKFYQIPR